MTLGIGCFLFGALCMSEGGFRFIHAERMHYYWESFKYAQPLAPSPFRLSIIRVMAAVETLFGLAVMLAGALL